MTDVGYAWVKLTFEVDPTEQCPHGNPTVVEGIETQVRAVVGDRYRGYEAVCDHTGNKIEFEVILHLVAIEPPELLKALHDIDTKMGRHVAGSGSSLGAQPSQWNVGTEAITPTSWNMVA